MLTISQASLLEHRRRPNGLRQMIVAVSEAAKGEEESMMTYLLGLVAFAVAGYMFFTKRETKAES